MVVIKSLFQSVQTTLYYLCMLNFAQNNQNNNLTSKVYRITKKSPGGDLLKKPFFKNFQNFAGKQLYQLYRNLFLIKKTLT